MNKRIKILMVAAVAIISIVSCKKEIDWNAFPDSNACKISNLKITVDGVGYLNTNFEYDNLGRVSKTVDGESFTTFDYFADKVISTDEDGVKLNATLLNGTVIKSAEEGSTSYYKYAYNAEGYLSSIEKYDNDELFSTTSFEYTNGNLTKSIKTYKHDTRIETKTFEYSTDLAVSALFVVDPLYSFSDYIPGNYYGKRSKNLIAKTIDISSETAFPDEDTVTYDYTKDTQGNYNTITVKSVLRNNLGVSNSTSEFILNYNCGK